MNFKERYEKVQWIVRRCARDYYVHLWESSDWEQEGMLVYHQTYLRRIQKQTLDFFLKLKKILKDLN